MVKYTYDAWGNHVVVDANGNVITDETHIAHLNSYRYRSYYYDTETGLYFLKTRYYDAEIGRFITLDGIEYLAPETINGLNLYAYCGNNPVMNIDPKGHAFFSILLTSILVGAVIGAVAGGITNAVMGQNVGAGILAGAAIGALFGLGIGLSAGLATVAGTATTIGSVAAASVTAFVGVAQVVAIVDSHIQVNKYSDALWEGSTDKIPSSKFNTAEKRVAYINAIYEKNKGNWTKAQLYRELKYHYAGGNVFIIKDVFIDNSEHPDIETIQEFRAYFLRFIGNTFSIFYS